ncbi:MAG: 50S ribosomal protein L11 methyltransferase [Verrucomicrobiales bacterium]|nr:50S ribosomal protein L11 methyltransferase [Verrucomicrobiales bacterium]
MLPDTYYRWSKGCPVGELEAAAALLEKLGHFPIVESRPGHKTGELLIYCPTREEAELLLAQHGGEVNEVPPEAWLTKPEDANTAPIRIRDRFLVMTSVSPDPVEQARAAHPDRQVLWFPPGLAFGTGDHATTATCLRLLVDEADRLSSAPWSLLDLGSGSAILAITGHHLGAKPVTGVEFDPMALSASKEYAADNGATEIELIEADAIAWLGQKPTRRHDIVAANLYSGLLKEVFPLLKPWLAAEGRIIFSGVLAKELPATLGAALECGYRPLKTVIRGKWSAGLLKRSPV